MYSSVQQQKYIQRRGTRCPECLSTKVHELGDPDFLEGRIEMAMGCDGCGGRWTDVYKLVGITDK